MSLWFNSCNATIYGIHVPVGPFFHRAKVRCDEDPFLLISFVDYHNSTSRDSQSYEFNNKILSGVNFIFSIYTSTQDVRKYGSSNHIRTLII